MKGGVFFVAGEASGDRHAADLIAALRSADPALPLAGAGGKRMQAAGMDLVFNLTDHAVVGLVEVLKNYRKFRRIFHDLLKSVAAQQPQVVVLVDFPGFNLRFARAVRRRFPHCRVIYYISPQLWAWHASRARQIERDVDLMLTIFPFEKDWYAKHAPALDVEFVGHPFLDRGLTGSAVQEQRDDDLVLLLPGSREREVAKLFPLMCETVEELMRTENHHSGDSSDTEGMGRKLRFVSVAASEALVPLMQHPAVDVQLGNADRWMKRARLAITASGTATMECALHGCPMVVVYQVHWLTYMVGRMLVQVDWLAMPNVIAGRELVPEFIQHEAKADRVTAATRRLLDDQAYYNQVQQGISEVIETLGGPGAAHRAASLIQQQIALGANAP